MLDIGELAHAQSDSFYHGKTVRIVVGFTPGGFYDRWARLLSRYMPKYIPGNPNFVVQNMPGASSVIAGNYVYNLTKSDGLTLLVHINSLYLDQIVGRKEVKFDVRKFEFIGTQEKGDPGLIDEAKKGQMDGTHARRGAAKPNERIHEPAA
jgi:tripartite-type tricarboxylate transporter receptor subunit TctC